MTIDQDVLDEMIGRARHVRGNAYVPYSKFPVAACLRGAAGKLYVGVNVDNSSYPEAACAEANAIGAMITDGERRITAILVMGGDIGSDVLCTPCGGCRQRLSEFSAADTPVYLCGPEGLRQEEKFGDLLPRAFSSRNLTGD